MNMLREWNGESNSLIVDILSEFGIENVDAISLLKYEALTPDSFIWYFSIQNEGNPKQYCLYAEDFIFSLEDVTTVINKHVPEWVFDHTYKLLRVKNRQQWEEASPVRASSVYEPPDRPDELMKYAATSGFDFVFLGRITNN